jgi:RNA polymerase sigma factor (sigma-70 family)
VQTNELTSQIPALRRYARVLTGNNWAADDLVQDTLERACTKIHLWRVGTNLRAWLFTLMHNIRVDDSRKHHDQSHGHSPSQIEFDESKSIAPDSNTELRLDLQTCISRLPEEQRVVLLLISLEDMSYSEVASITGVPIGTVMSRLSRARQRLQELMEPQAKVATVHSIKTSHERR